MSARIMTKQCVHCKRTYTYNPSTGDLGSICKHCHRSQATLPVIPVPAKTNGIPTQIKRWF